MIWELRNGKKHETATKSDKNENNRSETNPVMSAHGNNTDKGSETRILTQEEVDEQIRNYIAPSIRQLEDWLGWFKKCLLLTDPKGRYQC